MTKKTEILQLSNKIPNNWKEVKLNNLLEFITCGVASTPEYTDKDSGVLFLSAQNIDENFNISLKNKSYITKELHEKLTSKRTPKKEDVLYVRVGATIGKGAVVEIEDPFSVYVSLTHIRTIKKLLNPYFLNYFISNHNFKTLMLSKQIAGGGVGNLNVDTLKNEYIYRPPLREQQAIADYLDNKTSKIDSAVAELEKQKSLLIELKKSTIHQAVTKGLDLTVPMKDSGVEWIGEVPSHWDIKNAKDFYYFSMGNTILKEDLVDEGIPVYSATAEDKFFGFVKSSNLLLKKDDLVIPARGNSIGFVKIVKDISTTTQTTIAAKSKHKINSKFIYYYLMGLKSEIFKFDNTAIPQYTVETAKIIKICVPKKTEQNKIVDYLDKKTSQIDQSIEVIDSQIAKMKEYKKTLINDVVTGKIKVV